MGTKRSQAQINYFRSNGEPFDWKMRLLEVEYKTKSYSRNIRPNKDMVMYYIDNKWPDYQFEEESLLLVFEKFNDTNNPYHLFSRLLALNAIYSTAIDTKKLRMLTDTFIEQTKGFNPEEYDPTIVDKIRVKFINDHHYDPYSITTKYFSHINECEYPIYDSYVKTMLMWYRYQYSEFCFAIEDLNNYDYFRAIIGNFIKVFDLNCDLRTVDKFLWTAGKEFFPQYVYKDLLDKYKPQTNKFS